MRNIIVAVILLPSLLLMTGCGGSEVLVRPDYRAKAFTAARVLHPAVTIGSVTDRRVSDPMVIGSANVGMFNKNVPFRLTVPAAEFVRTAFDTFFVSSTVGDALRADVYIDTLSVGEYTTLFGEYGRVRIKVLFSVPVRSDSTVVIAARYDGNVRSGMDVTASLEPLLYAGVADCAAQFAAKITTMGLHRLPERTAVDTGTASSAALPVMTAAAPPPPDASTVIDAVDPRTLPKRYADVGVLYSTGGLVTGGVRIFYNELMKKDSSRSMTGFGYNLEVLPVNNTKDFITGTMVTYGGTIVYRGLLSDAATSGYVGLQGTITLGTESIKYLDGTRTSFFVGPVLRQTLGVSFNKKFYAEAGLYEILLLGSKMLPSDVGFTAGLSFGI